MMNQPGPLRLNRLGWLSAFILLIGCTPSPAPVVPPPVQVATESPQRSTEPSPTATPVQTPESEATQPPTAVPEPTLPPESETVTLSPSEVQADDVVVQFPAGSTGTSIEGSIAPQLSDTYRLTALEGQLMQVYLTSTDPANTGIAITAPGETIPFLYADAGAVPHEWNGTLSGTGEYKIDVYTFNQTSIYTLEIEITPIIAERPDVPDGFSLQETREIGAYRFEIWGPANGGFFGESIGRLLQDNSLIATLNSSISISPLSGTDINGNGSPDLLVYGYTGGVHCCNSLNIFDLGATPTNILSLQSDNCGAGEVDLNGDGILEIETCDDSFAYRYCAYAGSPAVSVTYRFDGTMYRPDAPNDVARYETNLVNATSRASIADGAGSWDNTNKCHVLELALIHLYTGNPTLAYQSLETYYTGDDLPFFWYDILQIINQSEMYVPIGEFPAVAAPAYYDIWLSSNCGGFGYGVMLSNIGADPCGEMIGDGIFFIGWDTEGASPLQEGEILEFPEECAADCPIPIVYYGEGGQEPFTVGTLEFLREPGRPTGLIRYAETGQVYSGPWYLRGDLTWEQR